MPRDYKWPNNPKKPDRHWTVFRILVLSGVLLVVTWTLVSMFQARGQTDEFPLLDKDIAPPPGITLDAKVLRILDGDTFEARILIPIVFKVRLIDCWSPEVTLRGNTTPEEKLRGLEAKAYLEQLIDGQPVRVHVPGRRRLEDMSSFGRVLGRAWITAEGIPLPRDISSRMIEAGHATKRKESRQ